MRQACSTVVWSRLPKASPISGRLIWVSSLASAIATWRGRATLRLRFFECMSEILILKYSATVFWIPSTLTWRFATLRMSRSASLARSSESSRALKREKASTFFSAPSSSRTFDRMCLAMKKAMSSDSAIDVRFGLLQHDRDAHLELRRLDRHRETPAEARDQALLHAGDLLGVGVAGDDDLLVRLDQRVERVEELLLGAALVREELDVVDEQEIEGVVVALELVERFLLVSAHHVGHVLLGVAVADARLGVRVGEHGCRSPAAGASCPGPRPP